MDELCYSSHSLPNLCAYLKFIEIHVIEPVYCVDDEYGPGLL